MTRREFNHILTQERNTLLERIANEGFYYRKEKRYDATTWDINNGYCDEFAQSVFDRLGGETDKMYGIWLHDIGEFQKQMEGCGEHYVIFYNQKYYDAECIGGVDNPLFLPFYLNKYKTREQVIKERQNDSNR